MKSTIVECQNIPIPTTHGFALSGDRLDVTFRQIGLYGVVVPIGSDQPFSCVVTTTFKTTTGTCKYFAPLDYFRQTTIIHYTNHRVIRNNHHFDLV